MVRLEGPVHLDRPPDLLLPLTGAADDVVRPKLDAAAAGEPEGPFDLGVRDVAPHHLAPDALVPGLDPEVEVPAAGLGEQVHHLLVHQVDPRLSTVGNPHPLPVEVAEPTQPPRVQSKGVVLEVDAVETVLRPHPLELLHHQLRGPEAGVAPLAGVDPLQEVVAAVRAGKGATTAGHEWRLSAVGVEDALEVEDLPVREGQSVEVDEEVPNRVQGHAPAPQQPQVGDGVHRPAPLQRRRQLHQRLLPLAPDHVVGGPAAQHVLRHGGGVGAAADHRQGAIGGLDPPAELLHDRPLG